MARRQKHGAPPRPFSLPSARPWRDPLAFLTPPVCEPGPRRCLRRRRRPLARAGRRLPDQGEREREREMAETSPRLRRDVAEMSPRCRREMASLIKDRRCGAPACRLRLARLQSARDRHVPAASPATQSLPRPRTLTRVRERRRTGSARGRSARRPSSPLRRARRRDSPAPPPPRSRARRSQPCASEGQGGGCRRLWL